MCFPDARNKANADEPSRKKGNRNKMEDFLPVTYDRLNSFLRRKAESELNENESEIEFEIQQLKEMIEKKQLPCYTKDEFLLWFLRSKKHSVSRAFDQLQKYSFQRHNLMNYYGFIDFHKIKVPIENGVCGLLPSRDAEGRAVLYLRACAWNSSLCALEDVMRAIQALLHFCLDYPATQVSGICFIFDNHLASLDTLRLLLKYIMAFAPTLNAFPGRFQLVALVNTNIVLRNLSPILLSVLPSKIRDRTHFYGDAKTALPQLFKPSILPEEFGGILGPITTLHHSFVDHLQQFVPKLRATNKYYRRKNTVRFPDESEDS